jgi:protein-S-isoprenylcysteine O-methyltransferase Ste14
LPAWWIAISGTIRLVLFYAVLPWVFSLVGTRHGWSTGTPGLPNLLGLAISGGGVFLLLWCTSLHIRSYSNLSPTDSFPPSLLVNGPYRFSRNPMYVADIAIWLGWSLFYGSTLVLLATFCFAGLLALVRVPSEERQLLERFGDEYQLYKTSVARWVGRRQFSPRLPAA